MLFKPFESNTISDIIEAGNKLEMSHSKLHFKSKYTTPENNDVIINYSSIIDKYNDFVQKIVTEIELSELEYLKYRFQPKRFCMDYYGTTELWSSLLRINNMTSAVQFTKTKIKAFTQDIFDVLNEIMIMEEEEIRDNRINTYGK